MRRSPRKLPLISSLEGGSSSGAVNTNSHMFHKHYDGRNKNSSKRKKGLIKYLRFSEIYSNTTNNESRKFATIYFSMVA